MSRKTQIGWVLLRCKRVKRNDYVGIIQRTRKDRIGVYRDYAVVRAQDRLDIENGPLEQLQAVLPSNSKQQPRTCPVTDGRAWFPSANDTYARFTYLAAKEGK